MRLLGCGLLGAMTAVLVRQAQAGEAAPISVILLDPNILVLLYALAGVLGGALNARYNKHDLRCPEGISSWVTGLVIGGGWSVYPLFDFDPKTPVAGRMIALFAIAFFAGDMIRGYIIGKFRGRFNGGEPPKA